MEVGVSSTAKMHAFSVLKTIMSTLGGLEVYYWIVGLLDCWFIGKLVYWEVGLLIYWLDDLLDWI